MKVFLTTILLLFTLNNWGQELEHSFEKRISLTLDSVPLHTVLDSIENSTGLYFSYSSDLIVDTMLISLKIEQQRIDSTLNMLFPDDVAIRLNERQIVLTASDTAQTSEMVEIRGSVFDRSKGKPIPYTNIAIIGTHTGTITNMDGYFSLKMDKEHVKDTVVFSCIGFDRISYPIKDLLNKTSSIFLSNQSVHLPEIKVLHVNPISVVTKCIGSINQNYVRQSVLLKSFYREIVKTDDQYTSISEAVVDIMKSSVLKPIESDQMRLVKGRKNPFVRHHKFVDFKLMGGPYYLNLLDLTKNQPSFLDRRYMWLYDFNYKQFVMHNNRFTYIIEFKPTTTSEVQLFEGELYIDSKSFALVRCCFNLTKESLDKTKKSFIQKKSRYIKARPVNVAYQVDYVLSRGKWFLNSIDSHLRFKIRSKRKLFSSTCDAHSQMLITGRDYSVIYPIRRAEKFHPRDILSEQVIDFSDSFWSYYNILEPTEDIKEALSSFSRAERYR